MKTIIERGASWTLEETKMLLALWGQDLVQRQTTNTKRTKEVYEKISEKFNQNGFERTAEQVRTRVFNMIAEYRRILKDPNPERMKKCIFFEALHKIYQARHMDDVKSALDDYEPEYPYSPTSNTISSERGDESVSDSEATDGNETATINNSTILTTTAATPTAATPAATASPTATPPTTSNATSSNIQSNNNNNVIISNNTNNTTNNDNNIGDTNSTNNVEKDSPVNSHVQTGSAGGSSTAKKIKLEKSPNQSQANATASTTLNANSSSSPSDQTNAKQNKSSSSTTSTSSSSSNSSASVPIIGSLGGPSAATSSSIAAANTLAGATPSSSSTPTSSSQRHQSLLLPHATTSSSSTTSTPISKLATSGSNNTPSYINVNSARLPIIRTNQLIGHSNGNDSINLNGAATRLPTTAAITSHQLYQAPVNTFDVTSSALLIDRMFAHLSRESENMREWIALEKERLALERTRRQQETEREVRRERVLIDTLMRFQEQWLAFVTRLDPRILENATESPPELKIPPREAPSNTQTSTNSTTSTNISTSETSKQ